MEKLDMSLDDIIKLNKKQHKQNIQKQQNAKKKKKTVAVTPQNRFRQFRGQFGAKAKQGTFRGFAGNRNQQKNNGQLGTSPLNRQGFVRKQTWQNSGAGNVQVKKRMGQRKHQSLKRQQAAQMGSNQMVQKASTGRKKAAQQARQKAFNFRSKLPQLSTNKNVNPSVGMMRSDLILQQQLQQQHLRKQRLLTKQQNQQKRRRWGRTNATKASTDDAIFTISVANVKTDNDVKVILKKPRIRRKPAALIQNQSMQQISQQNQNKNSDVQVVIANQNQRKRPRLRRNKKVPNQMPAQTSTQPQQQWPSLAEQIKLMQPSVSTKYTFNRADFGKDQTGVLLTDRFTSASSQPSAVSHPAAPRVVMF